MRWQPLDWSSRKICADLTLMSGVMNCLSWRHSTSSSSPFSSPNCSLASTTGTRAACLSRIVAIRQISSTADYFAVWGPLSTLFASCSSRIPLAGLGTAIWHSCFASVTDFDSTATPEKRAGKYQSAWGMTLVRVSSDSIPGLGKLSELAWISASSRLDIGHNYSTVDLNCRH